MILAVKGELPLLLFYDFWREGGGVRGVIGEFWGPYLTTAHRESTSQFFFVGPISLANGASDSGLV